MKLFNCLSFSLPFVWLATNDANIGFFSQSDATSDFGGVSKLDASLTSFRKQSATSLSCNRAEAIPIDVKFRVEVMTAKCLIYKPRFVRMHVAILFHASTQISFQLCFNILHFRRTSMQFTLRKVHIPVAVFFKFQWQFVLELCMSVLLSTNYRFWAIA